MPYRPHPEPVEGLTSDLEEDDLAVLHGLLLAWLRGSGLLAGMDEAAALEVLLALRAKDLIDFRLRPAEAPGQFHFSVVIPPTTREALSRHSLGEGGTLH